MLDEYGVRLNVLGKTEMLPEKVQESVRIAQEMTKNNDRWAASDSFPVFLVLIISFLEVYPEPLYALHVQGRNSYSGRVCHAGKDGGRPK